VAIKWAEHDCWWIVEPPPSSSGWAHPAANFDGPDAWEWLDPTVDHHTDLTRWTNAVRNRLAGVEQVLDGLERHPWG
jgi:hypothetical protein